MNGLHRALGEEIGRLVRQSQCGAEHPKNGTRCVLRALDGHVKHKTELSERWTS